MRPPLYYASGSSRPADIRGFSSIKHPIGVSRVELSENAILELEKLSGTGIPVFVDSGAFSEIEFNSSGPRIVNELTHEHWGATMALYRRLGQALGTQLSVVAPDRVADQEHTLCLLSTWAIELEKLHQMGVGVFVPIQRGQYEQCEFYRECKRILPWDWTAAIPSKKEATTYQELMMFVREIKPRRLHFLGLGERSARLKLTMAILDSQGARDCIVSLDSNKLAASVGKNNGTGGGARCLTVAQGQAREYLELHPEDCRTAHEIAIGWAFG